ncbi:hypothetical protein V5N11_005398 [Cardamine amara subsp. amara]|uniref:Transposase MuDR plant domain-containing protein n=1 Tax=Cardamine amara subsp. amara TaxID=228776 RepID=A0ABD0ZTH4_CARAN
MNLFVTFEPRREMQRLKNGGCINIHEGNIIRLSDSSPSFSSASLSESGKGSDNRTRDDARYAANDDVQEENQIVQYVYPTQDLPRDRCGVIDLNNIYGTDMIVELEKVEALAKEAQGFPSTSKGKQKMVQINNDAQTPSSNNGCEPYATAEEVEYNYDYWNALITKEYGIGVDVQSLDVGETSNYVRPPTDAQEERQIFNIETVVQESSGHDDGQHTKSHDHLAIQSSLANIYNDILEGDSLSAPDCEPCFGDQLLQSEDMESRVFDPANDAIYIGRVFRNKVDMQTAVAIYAIKRVFNYKQVKSDKERVIMKCVDDNCHWRVYGHVVTQGSENIQIRTARLTHTCSVQTRSQFSQNATSKVVAQVLRSKYTNGKPGPRAVDIPAIVLG